MADSSPSASRCVSTSVNTRRRIPPASDGASAPSAEPLRRDTNADRPNACGTNEANTAATVAGAEGRSVMLIAPITADERLTTTHRAKLAYVYVRQSSLNQVG